MTTNNVTIILATGNKGKIAEIREIFQGFPGNLISMREYGTLQKNGDENGDSFAENAIIKADWVYHSSHGWTLADDSGLVVDALGGAPGIRSARFAGNHGDDQANNNKLMSMLDGIPYEKRTARFICAVALRISASILLEAEGRCEGTITLLPQGTGGFGYDPLFVPDGFQKTFAELNSEEKIRVSHRGKAIRAIREKLNDYLGR